MRLLTALLLASLLTISIVRAEDSPIKFERQRIDGTFRSEGAAVGDFNKDGQNDIAAGYVWYEGPEFKEMHCILEEGTKAPEHDPKQYSHSFCTWADDLNGDGWADILVTDFPGQQTWWFENPKEKGKPWKRNVLTPVTNNESPTYLDLDGDGQKELICAVAPSTAASDGPDRQMAIVQRDKDPSAPWIIHAISKKAAPGTQKYSHGLGVGDVNSDGKNDILCGDGWWENAGQLDTEWAFHSAPWGGQASTMYAFDIDGDKDADVVSSSPHGFGLWWHENLGDGKWAKHEIDMTFSQIHAICLADMNGDKLPDLVCGKRYWAHAAGDPGVNDPAVFKWFQLTRKDGKAEFVGYQFDHDSGHGTQFEVADVNKDGKPDVVASNKKGTHLFLQK